jgi:hypothetical protein
MKPIFAGAICVAALLAATAASSQLLKAPAPKAGAPAPKAAAAPVGPTILGQAGIINCSQWTQVRTTNPTGSRAEATAWVAGFLTGINYTGVDPTRNVTNGAGAEAIVNGLDQDCRNNPNVKVADVLWRGAADLLRRKGYDVSSLGNPTPLPKLR